MTRDDYIDEVLREALYRKGELEDVYWKMINENHIVFQYDRMGRGQRYFEVNIWDGEFRNLNSPYGWELLTKESLEESSSYL